MMGSARSLSLGIDDSPLTSVHKRSGAVTYSLSSVEEDVGNLLSLGKYANYISRFYEG